MRGEKSSREVFSLIELSLGFFFFCKNLKMLFGMIMEFVNGMLNYVH